MPEDRADTSDHHSSVQIPCVLFKYQYIHVDTTSGWTGVTSERTSEAQSYTQGSSDVIRAKIICTIVFFRTHMVPVIQHIILHNRT